MESEILNLTNFNFTFLPIDEEIEKQVECYGATNEELIFFRKIAFILEAVIQPIIGIMGLIANAVAIPILCRWVHKKLRLI